MVAAISGRVDRIQLLLQAGAEVNITREEGSDTENALMLALSFGHPEAAQLLLDHGADKTSFQRMSPGQAHPCLTDHRILRMFFIAGVDVLALQLNGRNFEELARGRAVLNEEVLAVIDGVYRAGSYAEFILHEYKQILRIRSLLARGRATMAPSTPDVIARLFGGTAATSRRPRTRRSQLSLTRPAGVPDPIFWEVMEYWRLGDWRRPGTLPDPDSEE